MRDTQSIRFKEGVSVNLQSILWFVSSSFSALRPLLLLLLLQLAMYGCSYGYAVPDHTVM